MVMGLTLSQPPIWKASEDFREVSNLAQCLGTILRQLHGSEAEVKLERLGANNGKEVKVVETDCQSHNYEEEFICEIYLFNFFGTGD